MKLKSFEVINSNTRISSIDIFRAFAILPVVVYHFHHFLPYGYLGVDLFFVISGFLVGSILIKKFKNGNRISFFNFFLQRGFKIWPSYYSLLIFGGILVWLIYRNDRPDFIIRWQDYPRYIFFYHNYTRGAVHWTFDHVWSLCIEEHFYILLPLMIIIIKAVSGNKKYMLLAGVIAMIVMGVLFKYLNILYSNSKDTNAGTHCRIDALGWGVLLGVIIFYYGEKIRNAAWRKPLFLAGVILLAANITCMSYLNNYYYQKIIFNSLTPFCFFLMILGTYFFNFSNWRPFRVIAYYSYNWYLWHPVFMPVISRYLGVSWYGLIIYMIISFAIAIFFTVMVEERFLRIREKVLPGIFKKTVNASL